MLFCEGRKFHFFNNLYLNSRQHCLAVLVIAGTSLDFGSFRFCNHSFIVKREILHHCVQIVCNQEPVLPKKENNKKINKNDLFKIATSKITE